VGRTVRVAAAAAVLGFIGTAGAVDSPMWHFPYRPLWISENTAWSTSRRGIAEISTS
jgi:hypothetical protein